MNAIGHAVCVLQRPGIGLSRRAAMGCAAAVVMAPCGALAAVAEPDISIGLMPAFISSDLDLIDRIKTYPSRAIGRPVRVVTRRTYQEITSLLISGQLDAAWICGYPFVANRQQLELAVHDPLQRGLGDQVDEVAVVGLLDHVQKVHGVVGQRGPQSV